MSNTSLGRGIKGSKFWMQMIPNTNLKEEFNQLIGDNLRWLSPLENEEYKEYELHEELICKELGISNASEIFDFWPRRQPQWDGIAVSDKTHTLYIIEAKAHLKEMDSHCTASEKSKDLIKASMREVHDQHYPKGNFDQWMDDFYQLGNRLTFLQKMKKISPKNYPNVKLVLLNFVNDYTYRETSLADWKKHYKEVFKDMVGTTNTPDDVLVVYCDVKVNWHL